MGRGQFGWVDSTIWREVWRAVQKILAACVLIGAHQGLVLVLRWADSTTNLPVAESVIQIFFYLAFRVIAIRLVVDAVILLAFAPWWPPTERPSDKTE
jgi:hypothetical protein